MYRVDVTPVSADGKKPVSASLFVADNKKSKLQKANDLAQLKTEGAKGEVFASSGDKVVEFYRLKNVGSLNFIEGDVVRTYHCKAKD